jgi:myosin heavy subunit
MKKTLITVAIVVILALAGVALWLFTNLQQQKQANEEMQELAELDKQEMENEYERFTLQYGEMITQINNDSIVAQLTQEQLRTQQLLEELKRVKANDAREITRLKKELAAVREVLRSYIRQVDSLNQINASLRSENSQIRSELAQTNREKEGLQNEKQTLTEKVAIAAQLDATGITLTAMKGDKPTRKNKLKKANKLKVTYTISKNVTASNGQRTIYTSIRKPNGDVLAGGGSFSYENKQLKASAKNTIEYTGEQITVTAYWTGSEVLSGGDYLVSIFADGHLIGSGRFNMVE